MQCREQPLQLITARIVSADIPGALRLGGFVQRQRLPRLILELIHADTALREHSAHRRDRRHGVAPARVMSEVNDRLGQLGGRDAILERFIRIVAKLTRLPADNQSERVRSRRSSAGRFHTSPKRRARVYRSRAGATERSSSDDTARPPASAALVDIGFTAPLAWPAALPGRPWPDAAARSAHLPP